MNNPPRLATDAQRKQFLPLFDVREVAMDAISKYSAAMKELPNEEWPRACHNFAEHCVETLKSSSVDESTVQSKAGELRTKLVGVKGVLDILLLHDHFVFGPHRGVG